MIKCISCGESLEDDAMFCTTCGTKIERCPSCGEVLEEGAIFCNKCGFKLKQDIVDAPTDLGSEPPVEEKKVKHSTATTESSTSERKNVQSMKMFRFDKKNYFLYIIAAALLCVVGVVGFQQYQERSYVNGNVKMAADFGEGNKTLIEAIKTFGAASTAEEKEKTFAAVKEAQENLESIVQNNASRHVPNKYMAEDAKIAQLLTNESAMIKKVNFICENPTDKEARTVLEDLHTSIEALKGVASTVAIPGVSFTLMIADVDLLNNEMQKYMDKEGIALERRNREKAFRKNFFSAMDNLIQHYDEKKYDMGSTLETVKNGSYNRNQYLSSVDNERRSRVSLREEVSKLQVPENLTYLKRDFGNVLTMSIDYCNKMYSAGSPRLSPEDAQNVYVNATKLNEQVQTKYQEFIKKYNMEKEKA